MSARSHEDKAGVFVPLWAMELTDGNARDAMVLAQITWWLQPTQRTGKPRTRQIVERDGHKWLYLNDAELGEETGMSADQVRRARLALAKAELIAYRSATVAGAKRVLVRVGDQTAISRNTPDDQTAIPPDQTVKSPNANGDSAELRARAIPSRNHGKKTEESSSSSFADVFGSALANGATPNGVEKPTSDPIKQQARELTVLAFEQTPRPAVNGNAFPAVQGIVEKHLRAGRDPEQIRAAILAGVDVWTANGLGTAIAKGKPKTRLQSPEDRERQRRLYNSGRTKGHQ